MNRPPFDIGGEHILDFGDVVVPLEKIEELVSERKAAAQQAEQAAKDGPDISSAQEKAPEEQTARKESPPKTEKAKAKQEVSSRKEGKTPEAEKGREPSPAQKAGETRKARNPQVIDFMAGKRTSPLPDGKPVPEPAVSASAPREAPRSSEPEQIVYIHLWNIPMTVCLYARVITRWFTAVLRRKAWLISSAVSRPAANRRIATANAGVSVLTVMSKGYPLKRNRVCFAARIAATVPGKSFMAGVLLLKGCSRC